MTNVKCGWQYIVNLGQCGCQAIYGGISASATLQPHFGEPRDHVPTSEEPDAVSESQAYVEIHAFQ